MIDHKDVAVKVRRAEHVERTSIIMQLLKFRNQNV